MEGEARNLNTETLVVVSETRECNGSRFDSVSSLLTYMVCNFLLRCANSLDRSVAQILIDKFGCFREARPCHTREKNANVPELKSDGP